MSKFGHTKRTTNLPSRVPWRLLRVILEGIDRNVYEGRLKFLTTCHFMGDNWLSAILSRGFQIKLHETKEPHAGRFPWLKAALPATWKDFLWYKIYQLDTMEY